MIKFEVIVSDVETVVGDFKIPPGQRALKIVFEEEDVYWIEAVQGVGADYQGCDPGQRYLIFWGTKLAALERMLRESIRKVVNNGRTDRDEG